MHLDFDICSGPGEPGFLIQTDPLSVDEFVFILNAVGHREEDESPTLVNTINYDCQVEIERGVWRVRPPHSGEPVVLVTFDAAQTVAELLSCLLLTPAVWESTATLHVGPSQVVSEERVNLADTSAGPLPPAQLPRCCQQHAPLLGNVSYWGSAVDELDAWKLGRGWNKPAPPAQTAPMRTAARFEASVSTGLRFMVKG